MVSHLKATHLTDGSGANKRFHRVGKFAQGLSLVLATPIVVSLLCLVLGVDCAEAATRHPVLQDQGSTGETRSRLRLTPAPAGPDSKPSAPTAQGSSSASTPFRDVPSISGRYSVGGTLLMPYIGAGYRGGYVSDLEQVLAPNVVTPSDSVLRSQFGQGLTPNEFQMGIRIPF